MKLSALLSLPSLLASVVYANSYAETLHLKPLPRGALYAGFNFTASTPLESYANQHFRYFPRSLGQILQYTHTAELHLRFALGRWDEESWGGRPRNGRREGGTGVELWAWLEGDNSQEAQERWGDLVNSLSGLFCASLNFIDSTKTISPTLSFEPEGTLAEEDGKKLHLMHGMLPHEVVCTENLTPFLKLLSCKGKAGVSSLLDGHKVFDANWQTMAIDVRPVCTGDQACDLEIVQTVDMVLDVERSVRPRDDPIPRPRPVEEILCDDSKGYNAHDTCYPKAAEGEAAWSVKSIFGRPIQGSCRVGSQENAPEISLEVPVERQVSTVPEHAVTLVEASDSMRLYKLNIDQELDIQLPQQFVHQILAHDESLLRANRQMTGYGQERGGMHTIINNPHAYGQRVVYLESLPWFLRPYVHTLTITGANLDKMYYTPAIDRKRGTSLELLLDIPAHSTVEITYDFEKAILRYTEYPPDANRGFDIPPAILRVLSKNGSANLQGDYLRTTSLLLPLPTPDFSMPYNVIILTSTVIALGFGSIFNLLIRRFVLLEEVPKSPLTGIVQNIVAGIKGKTGKSNAALEPSTAAKGGAKATSSNGSVDTSESKEK